MLELNDIEAVDNIQGNNAVMIYLYRAARNDCVDWALNDPREHHSHVASTVP